MFAYTKMPFANNMQETLVDLQPSFKRLFVQPLFKFGSLVELVHHGSLLVNINVQFIGHLLKMNFNEDFQADASGG